MLLLAKFFGPAVAGFYILGVRCIQVPMNFLLTSLRQVFFQKASATCNSGGDVYGLFRRATLGLLAMVALPATAVVCFRAGDLRLRARPAMGRLRGVCALAGVLAGS